MADLSKPDRYSTIELKDVDSVDINLVTNKFNENTFGGRLRKSRIELSLYIPEIAKLCGVTPSVISGYEGDRYFPSKAILDKLSSMFDINYLCCDGYTYLLLNYDKFVENLKSWINTNNLIRVDAAAKLGVSTGTIKYWINGGIITVNLYNKIKSNIIHYNLI